MPAASSALKLDGIKNSELIARRLLKATKRSTHKRYQTGCVITNKTGGILTTGCSHASSLRLNELHSIHAEIHALMTGRFYAFERSIVSSMQLDTAYICTIARKSGNFVFSAPCITCAVAMRAAGIKRVVYHNGENHPMTHQWNELVLDEMIESQLKVYPRRDN